MVCSCMSLAFIKLILCKENDSANFFKMQPVTPLQGEFNLRYSNGVLGCLFDLCALFGISAHNLQRLQLCHLMIIFIYLQIFFSASLWHLLSVQINRDTSTLISFSVSLTKNIQNCINLFRLFLISPETLVQFCCFENLCLKIISRDLDLSVVPQADSAICQGC